MCGGLGVRGLHARNFRRLARLLGKGACIFGRPPQILGHGTQFVGDDAQLLRRAPIGFTGDPQELGTDPAQLVLFASLTLLLPGRFRFFATRLSLLALGFGLVPTRFVIRHGVRPLEGVA